MNPKVLAILKVIEEAQLKPEEYGELARSMWRIHISLKQMEPLDHLLEHIGNALGLSKEQKEFELSDKLEFGK